MLRMTMEKMRRLSSRIVLVCDMEEEIESSSQCDIDPRGNQQHYCSAERPRRTCSC